MIVVFLSLAGWNADAKNVDKSKANKIKAGILYHVVKMITWPEGSFKDSEPIFILFLGKDDSGIGGYFASQVRSRSLAVKDRKLLVKQIAGTNLDDVVKKELKRCHVLFIMSGYKSPVMELLHALGDRPVLLIGESSSFPREGGMIGLSIVQKRVNIAVNLDAVENTDLKISAQLLQHATIVESDQ